ncbi:T9SS type A sorting domain-containing protein [candidate division KSB1 bacterium]|nr:T9SS type A sorting domain-containing protein [candidate division KSB1 bacterium]
MKTILFSLSTLLLCINFCVAQEEAHWPFDTDVADVFGYYDGEKSPDGVSFVEDATRGKVLQLDGVSGYVTLPLGLLYFVQDVTITCWFNWAGGSIWQRVYSFGNAMPNVRTLYLCPQDGWDPNQLHLTLGGQPPGGTFTWKDWVLGAIETNTWYFSAFVLSGDSCKFYLNDNLLISESDVLVNLEDLTPDSANYIGRSHWPDPLYNGMIDDLHFYPYPLTHAEILELYHSASDVNVTEKTVQGFVLGQNYPNPFNPTTNIVYSIPKSVHVKLKIFDLLGKEICTLVNEFKTRGSYFINFSASDMASGIYIYRLSLDGELVAVKRMVLLK